MNSAHDELLMLANLYCEQQLTNDQLTHLQTLLRTDSQLPLLFIEFTQLHGQLAWDAGVLVGSGIPSVPDELEPAVNSRDLVVTAADGDGQAAFRRRRVSAGVLSVVAVCLISAIALAMWFGRDDSPPQVADSDPSVPGSGSTLDSGLPDAESMAGIASGSDSVVDPLRPLELNGIRSPENPATANEAAPDSSSVDVVANESSAAGLTDTAVVAEIDRLIDAGWTENAIAPAADADDHEWVRRTYLTLTGRIPSIEEVGLFVDSKSPERRADLVAALIVDSRTSENMAGVWTNLLIGRSNARGVDQDSLFAFLQNQFAENRPWMETVGKLIAAEGRSDENGATNFLLAHLNDQATPATAVTARLFLGQQVHCTQCHDHPFSKERQQQEFWGLNAFFKQAERQLVPLTTADSKQQRVWTLSDSGDAGMTFYATLRGQQKAVPPEFAGQSMDANDSRSRRTELVRLLAADGDHQVAKAMVNRMWAQFFGYGFTSPIDDLGAHNPASHPELLQHLTDSFVASDYDLQRLMKWIAVSHAFHLSSSPSEETMAADDPEEGGTPLFARIYPRPLGPEQVYESIRIAIRSVSNQPIDSSVGSTHRRQWVEQFVRSYGTDENDEQLTFEGNIAQALLMMNGEDLQQAIPLAAAQATSAVRGGVPGPAETLAKIALATLNRAPNAVEEKAFQNRLRALRRTEPADTAIRTATEDMLWAYLNSSEFVSVN